ncbi:MAG: electron transport complex subunit RsxE [Acholeplasmatales bacterium]
MEAKLKKKDILLTGILKENTIFKMAIGLCPALAVSSSFESALGMGIMVIVVLIITNVIISALRNLIPNDVRIPAYIVIIATAVTALKMFVDAFAPALATSLGIFIPLITVNCVVLGRAEAFASKNKVIDSFFDGLGNALGFTLAIVVISLVRELLGKGSLTLGALLPLGFETTLKLFPSKYALAMLVQPVGAFLVIGLILAGMTAYENNKTYRMRLKGAKK